MLPLACSASDASNVRWPQNRSAGCWSSIPTSVLLPANVIVDEAIRSTFAAETTDRVEFHSEFLAARFAAPGIAAHLLGQKDGKE
jgi:hypothetical protein